MATRSAFGEELRRWRTERRFSQLELSTAAEVSTRHLSFLETGRAKPSREMVLHLAAALDVSLRGRNVLLEAAGYSPVYHEHGLDEPAMDHVRHVLDLILSAHEPFPALVVNRSGDVLQTNEAAARFALSLVTPDSPALAPAMNVTRLTLHPEGICDRVVNWPEVAAAVLLRLEREVASRPGDERLRQLLDEVLGYPEVAGLRREPGVPSGDELLVPLRVRLDGAGSPELALFTTIATIGAPYDITLEELRLETLFPADPETEKALRSEADRP